MKVKHPVIFLPAPENNQPARASETLPVCLQTRGKDGCCFWEVLVVTVF